MCFPELCEQKSPSYYLGWIWTHDLCNSRAVSYQLDHRDCPVALLLSLFFFPIGIVEEAQTPYYDFVQSANPTHEEMQKIVIQERRRPDIPNRWSGDDVSRPLEGALPSCHNTFTINESLLNGRYTLLYIYDCFYERALSGHFYVMKRHYHCSNLTYYWLWDVPRQHKTARYICLVKKTFYREFRKSLALKVQNAKMKVALKELRDRSCCYC